MISHLSKISKFSFKKSLLTVIVISLFFPSSGNVTLFPIYKQFHMASQPWYQIKHAQIKSSLKLNQPKEITNFFNSTETKVRMTRPQFQRNWYPRFTGHKEHKHKSLYCFGNCHLCFWPFRCRFWIYVLLLVSAFDIFT